MNDKIKHKRSLTPGSVPTTSSLDLGELAINVADGKIFTRSSGSNGDVIVSIVSANTVTTGSIEVTGGITGSLFGTASVAISSSIAQFAQTASFALNAGSSGGGAASNIFNYYNFI